MDGAEDLHYLESLFAPDPDLERVKRGMAEAGMPDIAIEPVLGRLLTVLVAATGARNVLEIGTLGGYSAICLAKGLPPGGRLISIEVRPAYAEVARAHVAAAGLADRVEIRVGEALHLLPQLAAQGRVFDLVFIDADKRNYPAYLDWALKLTRSGGLIVADNAFLHGQVARGSVQSEEALAVRAFNRRVATDPELFGTVLPAYDGLAIACVRHQGDAAEGGGPARAV